jgi:hypothetical protein
MNDQDAYRRFMGKAEFEKTFNTLIGLMEGIVIDAQINDAELGFLQTWLDDQRTRAHKHPFNEIVPVLDQTMVDGVLSSGGKEDILWLCKRMTASEYLNAAAADMQRLHALLAAIGSDGLVSVDELRGLSEWLQEHDQLKTCWPYDEVQSLATGVLADGMIGLEEHAMLVSFFGEFGSGLDNKSVASPHLRKGDTVVGLCAVSPEIRFVESVFCLTGELRKYSRKEFEALIAGLGGIAVDGVSKKVHYLVIGAEENPCWAYACYGRKVERAMELRKEGHSIVMVHESDFHGAVSTTSQEANLRKNPENQWSG